MQLTEQQIRITVQRMETQLGRSSRADIKQLFKHYRTLCSRFHVDLGDGRDGYLAQASALMLIQAVAQSE